MAAKAVTSLRCADKWMARFFLGVTYTLAGFTELCGGLVFWTVPIVKL